MAKSTGPKGLRFTRLKLQNWRNFKSIDLELAKRAFFVGPNASGKSNLLDAFRFLSEVAASEGGGLRAAVNVPSRAGVSAIRSLAARSQPDILVEVDAGTDANPSRWTYLLQFTANKAGEPVISREMVKHDGTVLLDRPDETDRRDTELLTQTHLQQVITNQRFRELAEFLSSVRYLHVVPQLVREPDRSTGRINDPYGGDFLERLASAPEKQRTARLAKILTGLKIAVPQIEKLDMRQDTRGLWHLAGQYKHWRPRAGWQTEERFSDGTLRLLGLLWAVLENGGPLLLEEPELSLHAEVARHIPAMFARMQSRIGRQVLVSTHSEALLSDTGIGLNEVFLLIPADEGTQVRPASSLRDVAELLEGGLSLGEIVLPRTRPEHPEQLGLFGD